MTNKKIVSKHFLLSILFHSLILVFFISWFHSTTLFQNKINSLPAYAYQNREKSIPQPITKKNKSLALEKKISQFHASNTTSSYSQITTQDAQKNLLTILHNAIASNQHYPEDALTLQQTGTVKIGFWLYPDGTLKQIALLKSSNHTNIDKAALFAVQSISNIPEATALLKSAMYFAVDVVFE